jgi:hypothetical protein
MLPVIHHGDYRTSFTVFILSEHVAVYDNMSYGRSLAKIGNSRSLFEHENRVKNKTQKYKINFTIFFCFLGGNF